MENWLLYLVAVTVTLVIGGGVIHLVYVTSQWLHRRKRRKRLEALPCNPKVMLAAIDVDEIRTKTIELECALQTSKMAAAKLAH